MPQETPNEFHMKDLFIDVKLEACANGSTFDYLGKKLFSADFYRENIGFGITNIDIEVNTSLQPLVSITFKDLYGNTIFGTQSKDPDPEDGQSIDYSTIFNWPPPKFLFSFKGYLGRSTTWVLNLKKTSTSFNSSDGSYDLKCEFVPNQWGFFADMPFLYLLAAKRLRKDKLGPKPSKEELEKISSVFDLIKIGKQVEVKTNDTTKEFDGIVKQLGSMKSNMARAMVVSNIIESKEVIDGKVNNRQIKKFVPITPPDLSKLGSAVNNAEKIEQKLSNPTELTKLNTYLLLLTKIGTKTGVGRGGLDITYDTLNVNDPDVIAAKNDQIELITKNLGFVDDEIKRLVFSTSESKLEKITIGEIFSQTAKDAAFIIGSIIDAGLEGYRGDTTRNENRDQLVKDGVLIGESFPLMINDKGEEVPATKNNLGSVGNGVDIEVDNFEMDFVRRFTDAISEGIARDLITDSNVPGQEDGKLLQRICNMEMASGNPYKAYYDNIATNILVRGGIVSHMVRSSDPNIPGDYHSFWGFDGDDRSAIEDIATRDASNITDTILTSLSNKDAILLKRFCTFFTRFYDEDAETMIKFEDGEKVEGPDFAGVTSKDTYAVLMSINPNRTLSFKQLWQELRKPSILEGITFSETGEIDYNAAISHKESKYPEDFLEQLADARGLKPNAQNPLSYVDSNYKAFRIYNNGIAYTFTGANGAKSLNSYWGVLFRGEDNRIAQEANNAPSDSEYKGEDKDNTDTIGQSSPLGYITVGTLTNEKGVPPRVSTLIDWRDRLGAGFSNVIDFDAAKNPKADFFGALNVPAAKNGKTGLQQFLWLNDLAEDTFDYTLKEDNNFPGPGYEASTQGSYPGADIAGKIGFTVCYHQPSDNLAVFDFFSDTYEAINHRIYVRKMCAVVLDNLEKIEDERNKIIGSVLGKAGESEGALYKQMHTLFHQWQSLSYKDSKSAGSGCIGSNLDEFRGGDNKFNVAEELEKKFGTKHYNMLGETVEVDTGDNQGNYRITNEEENEFIDDGTFVYDYPLQRITGVPDNEEPVKVRDSLINLGPMYKINGNTTVLNIIQQVCTKNNFLFVPIPGNPGYLDVKSIYSPSAEPAYIDIRNFFHVLFTPTPESRTKTSNNDGDPLALSANHENYDTNSFVINYGHPDNQIVNDIQVGTDDNKVTAESIVNLQRLVDNENQNKKVTTDCSMLPVLAGRSYKASIKMLGNAQVYPMQFFFLKNSPLFGGLYQVMKVKHSITPNDMTTSADGIRMRFSPSAGYGSIKPVTLQTFRALGELNAPLAVDGAIDATAAKRVITAEESAAASARGVPASGATGISGGAGAGGGGTPGNYEKYISESFKLGGTHDGSAIPDSAAACPAMKGILSEEIVASNGSYGGTFVDSYKGAIKGKVTFIKAAETAFQKMKLAGYVFGNKANGNAPVGDSYRSFNSQRRGHINILNARELWGQGKKWSKNGKERPGTKKPPWVAHPCSGYHTQGQAMDINQGAYYTKSGKKTTFKTDITSHGPLYSALYDAGLRRIGNEWWHWSIGEATHTKNQAFKKDGSSPADIPNYKKY